MAIPKSRANPASPSEFDSSGLSSLIRDASSGSTSSRIALPIGPNFPFFLIHWPQNWNVESEGLEVPTWLPTFSRHVILPGCNLNRTLRRGERPEAAYDAAVLVNTRRGATYLDPELHRLSSGGKYLREAPCRDPRSGREGVYYLDAWSTPLDALPGRRLRFRLDRAAFNRYRLEVVEQGVIRPPSAEVLRELTRRRGKTLDRVKALTALDAAEYKRRVKAAEGELRLHEGAIVPARLGGAPTLPSSPGTVPDVNAAEVSS
jgi:hypothetical protein